MWSRLVLVLMCAMCARVGTAAASPADSKAISADRLLRAGEVAKALVEVDAGLALEPQNARLLELRGDVLVEQRDYAGALAAFESALATGVTGQKRRIVRDKIRAVQVAKDTFLEITSSTSPVQISERGGALLCVATPSCKQAVPARTYRLEAKREGFRPWSGVVAVAPGKVTPLEIRLEELPSELTVIVKPADAPGLAVTVDDKPYVGALLVPAGAHQVRVNATGYQPAQVEVQVHLGAPAHVEVALWPLVGVAVSPPGATLELDGRPVALIEGRLAVPPDARELVARAPLYQDKRQALPAERTPATRVELTLAPVVVAKAAPPPPPSQFTGKRKLALGVAGLGVVALGAGVALGIKSGQLEDEAHELCPVVDDCAPADRANDLIDRGQTRASQANLAYGVGGAALVGAAVLWLFGSPAEHAAPPSAVSVRPRVGEVNGVAVVGSF